ncbi:LAS seventeen-binding protein [Apiospora phragmitis]|uniref:LAS seventeen-binding protein n=1 Tax=Apiospora phragmitis TaxID=2905665 RepID=A0ABR1U731_9PEZI
MSAQDNKPPHAGGNPNYYAETSHVAGASPAELVGESSSSQDGQPYYPPPPSGPPPANAQQQYYPPPPPGPPPNQDAHPHPLQSHPYTSAPPPSYEETAPPGSSVTFDDEKRPVLPPRPSSQQGQQGQGQGQAPYFEPPPTQANDAGQGGLAQAPYFAPPPGQASSEGPAAAAAAQQQPYTPSSAAAIGVASSSNEKPDQQQQQHQSQQGSKKKTFGERLYQWGVATGVPVNKITNKLGSEAFWPTTMDKECDKAARILKSFCKDGFYTNPSGQQAPSPGHPTTPGPKGDSKTLVKIPAEAIQRAQGLAIFTTFRTGLHFSGAGGSGIVVSRLPDGSWSPPSGFLVHTLGAGFMIGLDIYDSVCVLNTAEAVRAFARPRLSLGGEIAVVAGPVGAGKALEGALGAGKPVWSYMKSRGFYAGVQADGTVIIQRPDANAAFYGEKKITPERILKGDVKPTAPASGSVTPKEGDVVMWPAGARQLMEVLKSAEGKKADEKLMDGLGTGPTPGDLATAEGVHPEGQQHQQAGAGLGDVKYG